MSHKRSRETDSNGTAKPAKRARHYTDEDARLARLYDQLSDERQDVQLDGAAKLIEHYQTNGAPEAVLIRLIRGLCSNRKAARLGFFMTFVEALRCRETGSDLDVVSEMIQKHTEPVIAASKSERREYKLGRLTAYSATLHAGLLIDGSNSAESVEQILRHTLSIARKNAQLVEQCGQFWVDYVQQAGAKDSAAAIEGLLDLLREAGRLYTPEGVAVWLQARALSLKITFPKGIWQNNDPLDLQDGAELDKLNKALHSSPGETVGDEKQPTDKTSTGMARRSPHFVWSILISTLSTRAKRKQRTSDKNVAFAPGRPVFDSIWASLVDESFFKDSASPETKFHGFQICILGVLTVHDKFFKAIIGPKMLNCLTNQLGSHDRLLHHAAAQLMQKITSRAADPSCPSTLRELFKAMERPSSDLKSTNSRLRRLQVPLEEVIRSASSQALSSLTEHIRSKTLSIDLAPSSEQPEQLAERMTIAADQLAIVFEAAVAKNASEVQENVLSLLIQYASMAIPQMAAFSTDRLRAIRAIFTSRQWTCIRLILSKARSDDSSSTAWLKLSGRAIKAAGEQRIHDGTKEGKLCTFTTLDGAPEGVTTTIEQTLAVVQLASSTDSSALTTETVMWRTGIITLSMILLLQSCCGDEDALNMLEPLQTSYQETSKLASSEDDVFVAATDAVLFLLSKEETVFRLAAEHAYSTFVPNVKGSASKLLAILGKEENLAGQRDLFDPESNEAGSGSEHDSSSGEDSDVEVIDTNGAEDSEPSSPSVEEGEDSESSSEDGSDGDDQDVEEEEDAANQALNDSLGRLLGIDDTKNGAEDMNGAEHGSDSDSDMTDSDMEALNMDDKLSNIFRHRQQAANKQKSTDEESQKKAQKDAKKNMVQYKLRILGLVSIYIDAMYASQECLGVLLPLSRLVGSTRDAQLSKKASDLLVKYIKLSRKKPKGLPLDTDAAVLWSHLDGVHEEALGWKSHAHLSACSRAALYLAKVIVEKARRAGTDADVTQVVSRMHARYEESKRLKEERESGIPELFWDNFRTWLTSMDLK